MSGLEADLMQMERQGDDAPPPQEPAQEPAPAEQDTAERDVAQDTLDIPDSSVEGGKARYVPLSALEGARNELKEIKRELADAKTSASRATELEARFTELQSQIQQILPKAQAYDAALLAQQHQPQRTEPTAEDRAELEEIARDFDFYKPDGQLDLAKAERHLKRTRVEAERIAQQQIAPWAQQTVQERSQTMLSRALNSQGQNGEKPDADILRQVWARLDPGLTATPEGAKQAWAVALGYTVAGGKLPVADKGAQQRGTDGKFTKQEIPPPLHTERAGGRDVPGELPLSEKERQFIKQVGMTEEEYFKSSPPWMRR